MALPANRTEEGLLPLKRRFASMLAGLMGMMPAGRGGPLRYLFALIVVAIALGAREALGPASLGLQFITFFPAVALSAVCAGFGPGMLAMALCLMLAAWLYFPPYGALPLTFERTTVMGSLAFFLDQLLICAVIEAMHRHYRSARLANLQMMENRDLLQAVIEGTSDPVAIKDRAGRYLHCNKAHLQVSGKTLGEVIGQDAFSIFAADEAIKLARIDAVVMDSGKAATLEEMVKSAAGEKRTFLTTKGPLFDRAGRVTGLFSISRDVTERYQLEAERQREHVLLTGIMNATDIMLVYLDPQFNFAWVNQAYADSCKMAQEAMLGRNHFELYPHAENEAIFRRVRDSGQSAFYQDKPFEFPDQPERGVTYWDWSLTPDHGTDGQLRGLVLSMRETSADVRARQAVRESEQRFAALADAAPVLIWMSGPDLGCNWFNQQWLDFTGRSMEQELNGGWTASVHADDRERCIEEYLGGSARRQPFTMEYRLRDAAGHYRWVTDHAVPRHSADGSFLGYIGACADITERHLAEQALRENEQKLTRFIDGAPAGIAMFDRDMRYLAASRRYLDDYHIAELDVIGRSHYAIFPEVHEQWSENYRRCLAGETQRCEEEAFTRPDGSVRWLRWEIRPWLSAQGEIGGIILFTEDISARKQAEHELRMAKAEAEQANRAKSRFLAAASHDLRQPLSALGLYVGVLKHKLAPADAPLLSNMVNCVANLSELLSDLLDVSKLDAGVVTPEVSDFSVADLLAGLAAVHAPEALLKGLRYRPLLTALYARTDPVLFRRILGNLIANAVRYTETGGVLVGCRRRLGKTWIEVWDSGIGIPEHKIGEIFEEFRQLGNDERNRGSGLGLAIAAKAAALLGLQIRVRSRPGKGSLFAVELPLGQAGGAAHCPAPSSRPLHIGVVDDNAGVLGALACSLEDMGHQVTAADSAAQLLGRLGDEAPDLVISDFRLAAGQTGFDVIGAARQAFGWSLPALLITGDTDPKLMRSMTERGIPVLHKPLQPAALQAAIGHAIAGAAPQRAGIPPASSASAAIV